jgi:hypothetical protein
MVVMGGSVHGQVGWAVVELRSGVGGGMWWQWIGGDMWWAGIEVAQPCWVGSGVEAGNRRRHIVGHDTMWGAKLDMWGPVGCTVVELRHGLW